MSLYLVAEIPKPLRALHDTHTQIVFPRPGALGLNLRSYMVEPTAGARPGINPYGCLEVLEAQGVYLQVGDTSEIPPPAENVWNAYVV